MAATPATRMRAAVYRRPGEIEICELPVPEPGPGEALVAVSHCGICGTDLHLILEGMGVPDQTPGHEWSGRVVATGAGVSALQEGDAVVGGPRPSCGRCPPCLAGRPSICRGTPGFGGGDLRHQGAFAGFLLRPENQLEPIPNGLSPREAALAEPLAVALHAITVSGVGPESRVWVTGAGPLGLLLIAALRAQGVEDVRASEPSPLRRERARSVGATAVHPPGELVVPRMPFESVEAPVDVVFECSGKPEAMEAGLAQLATGGTLVLVGTGMRRPRFDPNRILMNELVVTGAYNYDEGGTRRALDLLAHGSLPTATLIEPGDVPLDDLLPALHGLARGEIGAKVMVVPEESANPAGEKETG